MRAGDEALRNATGLVQDSNRTFEIRASPWMARCRDGLMLIVPWTANNQPTFRTAQRFGDRAIAFPFIRFLARDVTKPRRNQAMNEMKLQREPFKPTPKNRSLKLW